MKLRAALVLAVLAYAGQARAEDDPFAAEYVPPKADVIGTSGGQFRMFGTMGGFIGSDIGWSGQGTMELMTHGWIGVRGSSLLSIPFGDDPQLWSFRLGPSLHLLPYHSVDLSIFGEGGFSLVDITKERARTVMPVIAGGGSFDIFLSSLWVLRFEGLLQIGIADRDGRAETNINPVGLIGFGLAL